LTDEFVVREFCDKEDARKGARHVENLRVQKARKMQGVVV